MTKQHILNEIKRTAAENGGVPLGRARFFKETGIRESDWSGRYWIRWNEALKEAGFESNKLQEGYDDEVLMGRYIGLIRNLGHIPVRGELKLERHKDPSFPSHNTFDRYGSKSQIVARVVKYCSDHQGFDDVAGFCSANQNAKTTEAAEEDNREADATAMGSVYLLKSGRYYKIGKTNHVGRREYELELQLPERARTVHVLQTDDPTGVEAYWHKRFADKRKGGEWFDLDAADVKAFRRRRFM